MKKFNALTLAITFFFAAAITTGCKKEDNGPEKTAAEKLEGTWKVGNQYLGGNLVGTSDGSTLSFNLCDAQPCTGIDYKASDQSSGTFTWELKNEDTQIHFVDSTSDGGFWNSTYDVVKLTDSRLTIKASSIFGEVKAELSK